LYYYHYHDADTKGVRRYGWDPTWLATAFGFLLRIFTLPS
jgi:hypothetical protein